MFFLNAPVLSVSSVSVWADLTHRWTFNHAAGTANAGTVLSDEVSALPATVRGVGATFDGVQTVLP